MQRSFIGHGCVAVCRLDEIGELDQRVSQVGRQMQQRGYTLPKTKLTLWPPNPKELLMATLIGFSRAVLGT